MSQTARCIPVKRPPTLHIVDGPFVPEHVSLDTVDRAWEQMVQMNPRLHDGNLLHVTNVQRSGCGGVHVTCIETSYRFLAVQQQGIQTNVRSLGVKGICSCGPHVLMGLRSIDVAFHGGCWEFVPGGSLEPAVDPEKMLLQELEEETAIACHAHPHAIAVMFDPTAYSWEIVYRLQLDVAQVQQCSTGWEYDSLRLVEPGQMPGKLSPIAQSMQSQLICSGSVTDTTRQD